MTPEYGYITLNTSSYAAWKAAVNGRAFDFDSSYGCQCYDLVVEFWWNVGFPQGYPTNDNTGAAYGIWLDRSNNVSYNGTTYFDLIYSKENIKKGDIIVYNYFTDNPYGHIGFADEDYNGTDNINILSQNNGGTPTIGGGTATNVANYDLQYFLGAFRYKPWHTTPPTPTPTGQRGKFPWVLYAKRLREKRSGI